MAKLLLPYAYNSLNKLVHIDNAHKSERYTCPNCGAELSLRISKIPQGQKYHKRNHFAHKENSDNHCSESFLHKLFKKRTIEFIQKNISNKNEFFFKWECEQCEEEHKGNLLKKAVKIIEEYDLGVCKPDIALLDKDNKVVIVIEVVVTHRPEPEVLQYYDENNIVCLQIKVEDFIDCDNIEKKLSNPHYVNKCPNPVCKKCGHIMHRAKMITIDTACWKCGKEMKVAMITSNNKILSPAEFNSKEIDIATTLGANIKNSYSKTVRDTYLANVCKHCNTFVGDFYMYEYYYLPHKDEKDIGYKCFNCLHIEELHKYQAEQKKNKQLMELMAIEGNKLCPKCGGILKVRTGERGPFYGCEHYPNCRYTETIILK